MLARQEVEVRYTGHDGEGGPAIRGKRLRAMNLRIEIEQETDGRWIAEVRDLLGVLAYGASRDAATASVKALALRVLADRRPV